MRKTDTFSARAIAGLIAIGFAASPAAAQAPSKQPVPEVTFFYIGDESGIRESPPAPDPVSLKVQIALAPGWKINSTKPLDEFLVPTSLEIESKGYTFTDPVWPAPETAHSAAMGGPMATYSGSFAVRFAVNGKGGKRLMQGKDSKTPQLPTKVTLHYQSCNGNMCYPPKSVTVER